MYLIHWKSLLTEATGCGKIPMSKKLAEAWVQWLNIKYEIALQQALKYKNILLLSVTLLLIISIVILSNMGRSFLPEFNEGSLTVSAVTLPGTSLEQSDALGRRVENILLQQPEVGFQEDGIVHIRHPV